ncbi:lipopolysaccharide assembly protein LapA domain-containing protein, partial [Rhodoferax sp. UBA5149]|uniref:lipopolysaccharide assembly protein LapA domain-containing protein n=1 Tax=Rhodoferax sp. UBA5149 TaxID=1947379 RepID=UPI0025D6C596
GTQWRAPQVLVVLTVFAAGVVVGVLGMVPRWWKHRRAATRARQATLTVDTDKSQMTSAPAPHGL